MQTCGGGRRGGRGGVPVGDSVGVVVFVTVFDVILTLFLMICGFDFHSILERVWLHFESILKPFWLHFGSLGEVLEKTPQRTSKISVLGRLWGSIWGSFFKKIGIFFNEKMHRFFD